MKNMNPLDILKSRKLDYIPPHFSKMALANYWMLDDNSIAAWIKDHSEGRYAVKDYPVLNEDGLKQTTFVAFEEEKELTFFMLAYPTTRR
jgi:hypothetical protein